MSKDFVIITVKMHMGKITNTQPIYSLAISIYCHSGKLNTGERWCIDYNYYTGCGVLVSKQTSYYGYPLGRTDFTTTLKLCVNNYIPNGEHLIHYCNYYNILS